ncbi:hypothetical protein BABINDRAFT_34054 [Babjeviella inositovora NRRL Y-12698]|uniref:DNA replication complex GINS protein SLD5 n=1 Tax=Babjeviella inositovora NRRL Y-12698 TaxID=984486 RepID=A0A1E3QU40_9ASCO|nr:uncharacterized protein BABINDRAFT_34054 [Babjeviella inositovora NRRL Y-12698]ODQ81203.1 hypothetical protein BABINDRAFT_34054 [Babjeviella inositovora NRRL Y-12698]
MDEFNDILNEWVENRTSESGYNIQQAKQDDLTRLMQLVVNERMAPDVLEYEEELLERILARTRLQIEFIEINSLELQLEKDIKLQLMIVELELERVNYLIRTYLRTRLSKIDKFTVYITKNGDMVKRLSPSEVSYMRKHFEILTTLYKKQFLSRLPELLQLLDDTGGGISMIEEPDLDKPVFVKVVKTISHSIDVNNEEVELLQDGIYVLRYSAIRLYIMIGDIKLI